MEKETTTSPSPPDVGAEDVTNLGVSEILERLGLSLSISDGTDRYAMYDELGRGGAGLVYYGIDKALHRQVAVKILRKRYLKDPAAVAHFLNEAKIMAKLEHPGIVPVFDIGTMKKGELFFSMEKVEGCTLRHILDRRKKGEPVQRRLAELVRIFERVCEIVAHAHRVGVVHRDLKPDNIMVGDFNTVYVMDWGISRDLNESERKSALRSIAGSQMDLTALLDARKIKGTPRYMSPEQSLGMTRVDYRSDVFSLGLILFEILTGHHPFETSSMREMLHNIKQKKTPSINHYFVPNDLKSICKKTLEKLPENRYPDAGPLAEDVSRSLSFQNVSVHKDNPFAWSLKFVRRHKVISLALVFILTVSGILGANWFSRIRYSKEVLDMAEQRMANAEESQKKINKWYVTPDTNKEERRRVVEILLARKNMSLVSARALFCAALKRQANELTPKHVKSLKIAWIAEVNYYIRLQNLEGALEAFNELRDGGFLQPNHPIMKWTDGERKRIAFFSKHLATPTTKPIEPANGDGSQSASISNP